MTGTDSGRAAQLYAAAVELFIRNGYREVDVAEIAAAAGTSHGTFYNYYRNKRDVLAAAQDAAATAIVDAASARAGQPAPESLDAFVAEFRARVVRVVGFGFEHAEFVAFLALTASGVDKEALARARSCLVGAAAQFTELLEYGRDKGWVQADLDLKIAGRAAVSAILMTLAPVILGDTADVDVEAAAALCADYLLRGSRGLSGPR